MPIIPTPPIQGSPPPISSRALRDFTGGLNLSADDVQLPDNQFPDALDIDIDVKGGFHRRKSFRTLGATGLSTAIVPKFLFHYSPDDGGGNGYILVGGQLTDGVTDSMAEWNSAAITDGAARSDLNTFGTESTLLKTWSGATAAPPNAVGNDVVVFIHRDRLAPGDAFRKDGTMHGDFTNAHGNYNEDFANPLGGTMPYASVGCWHTNHMFHADITEGSDRHPSRLRFSHPNWPTDYREDDFIDIGEGEDNDVIMALVSAQGRLFIFKKKAVYVLDGFGFQTWSVTKVASGIGACNKNCAATTQDGVVFFDSASGLHKITASSRTWKVEPLWGDLSAALSDGRLTSTDTACIASAGDKIAVSGMKWMGATLPNRTFVLDQGVGNGWVAYSVGFHLLCGFTNSAGRATIMGASPFTNEGGASTTYHNFFDIQDLLSSSVDDTHGASTVTYNGYLFTSWVDGGDVARKKRFRRFSLTFDAMANTKSFTVNGYRNWNIEVPPVRTFTVTATGTPTAAIAGQQNNVRGGALGTAYSAALKITGPNDVAWGVNVVTFRYVNKRIT